MVKYKPASEQYSVCVWHVDPSDNSHDLGKCLANMEGHEATVW